MTQPLHSGTPGILHECQGSCASIEPGHALPLIQQRVAAATPSKWLDAVVTSLSTAGWVHLMLLADDSSVRVWNHDILTESIEIGSPVALHAVYDVLSVGATRYNVLRDGSR